MLSHDHMKTVRHQMGAINHSSLLLFMMRRCESLVQSARWCVLVGMHFHSELHQANIEIRKYLLWVHSHQSTVHQGALAVVQFKTL